MKANAMVGINSFTVFTSDGEVLMVNSDNRKFHQLREYLLSPAYDEKEFIRRVSEALACSIEAISGGKIEKAEETLIAKVDDQVLVLPMDIQDAVKKLIRSGAEYKHLEQFWRRCLANPNRGSIEQLFNFIKANHLTITNDGRFLAYKGVTEDYKDCHTQTIDNRIGCTVEMPREEVAFNPDEACSTGLHVAALDYAKGYGSRRVSVLVDPADVVSVPFDANAQKIRVCKYRVMSDWTDPDECKHAVVDRDLNPVIAQDNSLDPDRPWTEGSERAVRCYVGRAIMEKWTSKPEDWALKLSEILERSYDQVYRKVLEYFNPPKPRKPVKARKTEKPQFEEEHWRFIRSLVEFRAKVWTELFAKFERKFRKLTRELDLNPDKLRKRVLRHFSK